jgi:hypothetical protein
VLPGCAVRKSRSSSERPKIGIAGLRAAARSRYRRNFSPDCSEALHLNAYDQVTLYHLALPELYRADAVATVEFPPSLPSNLSAIALPSDIDEARRTFDSVREAFLTAEAKDLHALRPRILGSWERSRSLHVDADRMQVPLALDTDDSLREARGENHWLLAAARPVVTHLRTVLGEMGYAIAVTDRMARVLELDGDRDARRLVGSVGILPGGDMSEDAVGTNGIGTVIADHRPLQIMAAEHLIEGFQPLACTGAAIRDPNNDVISGVLVVMSDYKLVRPTLLPAVIRCALEIEEEMAKSPALV